jgi:hypothetical protein
LEGNTFEAMTCPDSQILNRDTWLAFLFSDFIRPEDETGRRQCRTRFLDSEDQLRLARWQQGQKGPSKRVARAFLKKDGGNFDEYLDYCRTFWSQPWQEPVQLDWFSGF